MPTIKGQSIQQHALRALEERRAEEARTIALHAEQLAEAQHARLVELLAGVYGDDWAELAAQVGEFTDCVAIDDIRFKLRGDAKAIDRVRHARLEASLPNPRTGVRERAMIDTLADLGELVARVRRD